MLRKRLICLLSILTLSFSSVSWAQYVAAPQVNNSNQLNLTLKNGDVYGQLSALTLGDDIFVSSEELFRLLDFTVSYQDLQLSGSYGTPPVAFRFLPAREALYMNNKLRDLPSEDFVAGPHEFFINIDVINKHFPMELYIDYQSQTLHVQADGALAALQPSHEIADVVEAQETEDVAVSSEKVKTKITSVGQSEKVEEGVIIEKEVVREQEQVPDSYDDSVVDKPTVQPEPPTSVIPEVLDPVVVKKKAPKEVKDPGPVTDVDPNNFYLFEVKVQNLVSEELVDVYKHGDMYYAALLQVAEIVEFPLTLDPDAGIVRGWYIKESNELLIDWKQEQITTQGQITSLEKSHYFVYDDELYLRVDLLNQIFPLNMSPKYSTQRLTLQPTELLPFQVRKQRDALRQRWLVKEADQVYSVVDEPYDITWPIADIDLDFTYTDNDGESAEGDFAYSGLFVHDLEVLNMHWFAAGNERQLNQLRVTGKRHSREGNLPLGATRFEIGDVDSFSSDLVANGRLGRGVLLSNFALERADEFDTTIIEGDALPDWEVELYLNGSLFNFVTVGNDGRYRFEDVPIFYGANIAKLIFYGPQGEVREETKQYFIDDALLKEGEWQYRTVAQEKDVLLLGIQENDPEKDARASFELEYGLSDHWTLFAGTTYDELGDGAGAHSYQSAGIFTDLGGLFTRLDAVLDSSDGGFASSLTTHTSVRDVNIRFRQDVFDNFTNDARATDNNPEEIISSLDLTGSLKLGSIPNITYAVGGSYAELEDGEIEEIYDIRTTMSLFGVTFTNSMDARYNDTQQTFSGDLAARGTVWGVPARIDLGYSIEPKTEFQDVSVFLQERLTDDLTGRLDVTKSFIDDKLLNVNTRLNWNLDKYLLSSDLTFDDSGNVTIGMGLTFSLYQEPRTDEWHMNGTAIAASGGVSAVAFMDENYNGVHDEGEQWLDEVVVRRSNQDIPLNEDRVAVVTSLAANTTTNITLDQGSLEDPLWYAPVAGYTVVARPGVLTQVDFAVVAASEVEGTIYIEQRGGDEGIGGINVRLLDADGKEVAVAVSEFDGFFLFEHIVPGEYRLAVDEEQLEPLGVYLDEELDVDVEVGGEVYYADDMLLKRGTKATNTRQNYVGKFVLRNEVN